MEFGALLGLLALAVMLGVPLIAIVALIRVSNLSRTVGNVAGQAARISDVDVRLMAIDRKLDKLLANAAVAAPVATPPHAAPAPSAVKPTEPIAPPPAPIPVAPPPAPPPPPPVRPVVPVTVPPAVPPPPPPRVPPATPFSAPPAVSQGTAAHVSAANQPPLSSPLSSQSISRSGSEVEEMIAGHWLNYVGILAMAIAVAFFLKYAFDNNWIGPSGRVAIGVLIGTAMFPLSHWLLRRGYTYFSEGIAGLGAAVLYLSIWSGWHYYHLFPQNTAFMLMILITAAITAVAIARDSERIALLALIGGALTPMLVSTGRNEETALFTYMAVLGAGMLLIAFQRQWKSLPPLTFIATLVYFWGWYDTFYSPPALENTVFFATVFFILFAALPMVRSLRGEEFSQAEIVIAVSNAAQYLIALRLMLWPAHRWNLTAAMLALAAVHFVVAQAVPQRNANAARVAKILYTALALTFLTLAVPIGLDDEWITVAWAAEGAVLIWSGLRFRASALRGLGFILFLVVGVRLMVYPIHAAPVFLLNARFLTQALCAAAFLSAFLFARESDEELGPAETNGYYALAIVANFLFLLALSLEVWDFYGRTLLVMDRALSQQLAISVLWIVYALALMVGGVMLKAAALRWQALVLLGVAIAKVFFFDLSFLTRFYRIVSFFVLGLVLLLVSFFYQRRSTAGTKES
jgi:uncharacterized membrane protein